MDFDFYNNPPQIVKPTRIDLTNERTREAFTLHDGLVCDFIGNSTRVTLNTRTDIIDCAGPWRSSGPSCQAIACGAFTPTAFAHQQVAMLTARLAELKARLDAATKVTT